MNASTELTGADLDAAVAARKARMAADAASTQRYYAAIAAEHNASLDKYAAFLGASVSR